MRSFIFVTFSLVLQSWAFAAPVCFPKQSCTEKMQQIEQLYDQGDLSFANQTLSAYSGDCFHLSSLYDPNFTHHGTFVFFNNKGDMQMYGELGFFFGRNPYSELTTDQLLSKLGDQAPGHLNVADGQAVVQYDSEETMIKYSFRSTPDSKKLYVINEVMSGFTQSFMFCSMDAHP